MEKELAYCGLICSECPGFLATQENDDQKRAAVAEQWSKLFKIELSAQDINCDGCKSRSSRKIAHCQQCGIRQCCNEKKLAHCGICSDFPCEKLNAFFAFAPHAKANLETAVKKSGSQ